MAYVNPFLDKRTGRIRFPEGASMVRHVERWAQTRGDHLVYRFMDFSTEREGVARDLTWAQFSQRNRAIAARLQQVTEPGDRVAILCPQNLEYLVSFYGAMYSGRIAVPLFDPSEPGHTGRLHAVLDDCEPSTILTTTESAEGVRKFFRNRAANERPRVIAVDAVPDEVASTWVQPDAPDEHTIAYLQYTSGSTRTPAGVQITHLSLATNIAQVMTALKAEEGQRGVTWLPFFHDMGLITITLPVIIGRYVTFMTPAAFVRRPIRWIRELAVKDGDHGQCYSVAPNFAFEHAATRGLPKEGDPPLDLSNVLAILNGAEPVSKASMKKFTDAFAPYGLNPNAIKPSYGLAEATLFVSTTDPYAAPHIICVDREELHNGKLVEVSADSPNAVPQASCGKIGLDQWAVIVDPETASELPDGQVGEIWLHGNNMGSGYWNRPEETEKTFRNVLKSRTSPSHADGAPEDGLWMNTGDLGAYLHGEFYVTGRVKDLVIIDGRNHYPQDLEYTAQEAAPRALRAGFVAAFSVPANRLPQVVFENPHSGLKYDPENTSEQLVIVGERAPGAHKTDIQPIADDIRAAIAVRHGVTVRDVLLVPAGSIPRTSSGKIGHRACRAAYIDGSLRGGYARVDAFPDETE
ncbi:long-chain-fatty-acid--AMP ligase FadD32 [Mycobacterium sp.]|uniref:long-chain-fatty-acid--AMP ligase FadD32 n=1 Tax=Mycobacterium sp. TaxID=1785 RepID=UPI002D4FD7B0|nr:long-chain-fatty-acid--AMP ligase FadD32 [Mycobacterium sp.]HZA11006.1 long-chain-fatty-acid--AMP ligase FadD32 [Mycobacterium sp.]